MCRKPSILLTNMAVDAVTFLPNLLEPWKVISESGEMGQYVELTFVAKARFGKAAEMRPRLLALVQERMEEAGIQSSWVIYFRLCCHRR